MSAEAHDPDIFIFVPGFGDYHKMRQLRNNIRFAAQAFGDQMTCLIDVFKNESEFPLEASDFAPCVLRRYAGFMSDHIRGVNLTGFHGEHVLLLLDHIVLNDSSSFTQLHQMAHDTGIDVLSMTFGHPGYSLLQTSDWDNMFQQRGTNHTGRLVDAVEPQIALYNRSAFICMQTLMNKTDNHFGWGIDIEFSNFCHYKMGLVDTLTFTKHRGPNGLSYDHNASGEEAKRTSFILRSGRVHYANTLGYFDVRKRSRLAGQFLRKEPRH